MDEPSAARLRVVSHRTVAESAPYGPGQPSYGGRGASWQVVGQCLLAGMARSRKPQRSLQLRDASLGSRAAGGFPFRTSCFLRRTGRLLLGVGGFEVGARGFPLRAGFGGLALRGRLAGFGLRLFGCRLGKFLVRLDLAAVPDVLAGCGVPEAKQPVLRAHVQAQLLAVDHPFAVHDVRIERVVLAVLQPQPLQPWRPLRIDVALASNSQYSRTPIFA